MSGSEYKGGTTPGGRWGCLISAVIGAPLFFFLIVGDALGDCETGADCHKGFLPMVLLPTVLIVAPIGIGVRWVINRRSRGGS